MFRKIYLYVRDIRVSHAVNHPKKVHKAYDVIDNKNFSHMNDLGLIYSDFSANNP